MEFEYDTDKSESNKQKHGIDFEEARTIWLSGGEKVNNLMQGGNYIKKDPSA